MERRRRKMHAGECPAGDWAQGTRGAHIKHVAHVCDAGRVEIERLVERRVLPSRRWGIRSEARCEAERQMGSGAAVAQVACRGGPGGRLGTGQAAERTRNMEFMDVTLDVSKLSGWLNAVFCRVEGGGYEARRGARPRGKWAVERRWRE